MHHSLDTVVVPSGRLLRPLLDIKDLRFFQHLIIQPQRLIHPLRYHPHTDEDITIPCLTAGIGIAE